MTQDKSLGYLYNIRSIEPANKLSQSYGLEWIHKAYKETLLRSNSKEELENLDAFINKYCVKEDRIAHRFTDLDDYLKTQFDDNDIYYFSNESLGASLEKRMRVFYEKTLKKALEFYPQNTKTPEHLIHTSCTGYLSPSPLQDLTVQRGWLDTKITHAYHMGCYAALPSIRMGLGLAHMDQSVDVFHSELCTLHFSTKEFSAEQLVVQSLFADGYATYSLSQNKPEDKNFVVHSLLESRVEDSLEDMTWLPSQKQFEMRISKHVPLKLAGKVHEKLTELFESAEIEEDNSQIMKEAQFAIHPGGPKILDQIQMLLELEDWQIEASRRILKERGNMSSATLPHIWKELSDHHYQSGQKVVSLAFGPGLTLFGSVMEFS